MTAITIDLDRFCASEPTRRFDCCTPWTVGGYTFATDARIAVRIPTTAPDDELGTRKVPRMDSFFLPVDGDWQPWPAVGACGLCGGNMPTQSDRCKGSGEHRCEFCSRDGECERCDGEGTMYLDCECHYTPAAVKFGASRLSHRNAWLGSELPGCKFLPPSTPGDAVRFRFVGGEGIVMAMKSQWCAAP